ncbi:hypothetical protein M885DRAFT_24419 [Pelagophyceae sp. CCMP2097]|nr:hypothetical protein M885DRAFT_24419 [Pelagophyceae sp. CCMP2097]
MGLAALARRAAAALRRLALAAALAAVYLYVEVRFDAASGVFSATMLAAVAVAFVDGTWCAGLGLLAFGEASRRADELRGAAAAGSATAKADMDFFEAVRFVTFVGLALFASARPPRRADASGTVVAFAPGEERARALVLRKAPWELHKVDDWLDAHRGSEVSLLAALEARYAAAPTRGRPSTLTQNTRRIGALTL